MMERSYIIKDFGYFRRPTENAKIKAATKHFEAIGVSDYAVSVPGDWRV
jgi:type III restriction enzyme